MYAWIWRTFRLRQNRRAVRVAHLRFTEGINRRDPNAAGFSAVITLSTSTRTAVGIRSGVAQLWRRAHGGGRVAGSVGCSPALYHVLIRPSAPIKDIAQE